MLSKMKNRIIMGLLTILLLALNILIIYLFVDNKNSLFISLGYLLIIFILFRILLFIIQKILVKLKILKYNPDDFNYYDKDEQKIRRQANIKYKMQKDRFISTILYNIIFFVLVYLVVKFNNDESFISCLFVAFLLTLPSLIIMPRLNEWDGHGKIGYIPSEQNKPKNRKIHATTWNFGKYSETTYRDDDGNKVAESTSFDWGPVKDTTIKDKDGNKTKIEHWKF